MQSSQQAASGAAAASECSGRRIQQGSADMSANYMMQKARQVVQSSQQAASGAAAASECSSSGEAASSNGSCSGGQIQQRSADESAKKINDAESSAGDAE